MNRLLIVALCSFLLSSSIQSCYRMRSSKGGGQIKSISQRTIRANDIAVSRGFKIEPVTSGLTFPTAYAFDDEGKLYVIEAGYSYGEVWGEPKLLRIETGGKTTHIAKGSSGPLTGIAWYNGAF